MLWLVQDSRGPFSVAWKDAGKQLALHPPHLFRQSGGAYSNRRMNLAKYSQQWKGQFGVAEQHIRVAQKIVTGLPGRVAMVTPRRFADQTEIRISNTTNQRTLCEFIHIYIHGACTQRNDRSEQGAPTLLECEIGPPLSGSVCCTATLGSIASQWFSYKIA